MSKKSICLYFLFITVLILGLVNTEVSAQSAYRLRLDYIESDLFPRLELYVSVSDVQGLPVKNLTMDVFSVKEDGQTITPIEVMPIQNTKTPLAVVILIDTSASMGYSGGTPLRDSIEAAGEFINSLNAQDSVGIYTFSNTVTLVQDLTTDKTLAAASLANLKAENDTAMYDAIYEAAGLLKNRSERKCIVLVTDGVDSGISKHTRKQAMDEALRWSIPIFPVGFSGAYDSAHKADLEEIAFATGGSAQIQLSSDVLKNAFGVILQILREQYLIKYTSQLPADNQQHTVTVNFNYKGWYSEDDRTYLAYPGRVTITPPFSDNEVVSGMVRLAPQIEAPGDIARLEISLDGNSLTTVTAQPFEYVWDTQNINPGSHSLTFKVTDVAGNIGEANRILDVQPAITITFIKPKENAHVSGQVDIQVDVSAFAGVTRVEFYAGGGYLGEDTTVPYQFTWDATKAAIGQYAIRVVGYDGNGLSNSQNIPVDVVKDSSIAAIAIVSAIILIVVGVLFPIALRKRRTLGSAGKDMPAGPVGKASLHELLGLYPERVWPLSGAETSLGRRIDANDIPLAGKSASRQHAIIRQSGGEFILYTLNPANPALVNRQPVDQSQTLVNGDIIQMGDSSFRFEKG